MASINERGGKLFFDFRYQGHRCREYTALPDTAANRKRMQAVLDKITADIALSTFNYRSYFSNSPLADRFDRIAAEAAVTDEVRPDTPLFSDFAQAWRADKAVEWRNSYRESVDHILAKHLTPYFGQIPMGLIDRPAILAFRTQLMTKTAADGTQRQLKASTVNRIIGVLSMILDEAALRLDTRNPLDAIKRLKVQRSDIQPFSIAEVRQLIATVRSDYADYLLVRCFTGMRSGEANGLKWEFVDFERREIRIRETFVRGRTEYTKTDGSQREIQMSQPVFDALQRMHGRTSTLGVYVFCTKSGLPIDNHNFVNRIWNPLLRHLGLKPRRPYQMRHTCATLWLAAGESPEWIARQLGHTTTEMLFRVYSRYVPNLTRRDGSAFDFMVADAMRSAPASNDAPAGSQQEVTHG
ncbi:MAG: Arm DNA-binding domain-containing protein [Sinimarinibacterium flocculans]|uniref:Arm DNA-binding domain-containing protein n=1 Tax=Sinimarinibacterium flocculans TaxID=985250 RepID=UPI003C3A1BE1